MPQPINVERLQSNIAWAVANGLGARDLVPMLDRLIQHAPEGSECQLDAQRQLAEYLVELNPWRSSLLIRSVLRRQEDDRAWAIYGLAQILLGNHRSARRAYRKALALAPRCASYAHNLGHLLDVVFGEPHSALPMLRQAYLDAPQEEEIAASYAHALCGTGQRRAAVDLMEGIVGSRAAAWTQVRQWIKRRRSQQAKWHGDPISETP